MTEILTESFCERCGTRYTFESRAAGRGRRRGLRTLTSGLKNFVLSDDTSFGDAMAAARGDQEREVTNQQLDAFHKTFNFCMSCRQYTCGNCWNETEGRCLTCSPHLGHEILQAPFPTLGETLQAATEPEHERQHISAEAWPALDLSVPAGVVEAVAVVEPAEISGATAEPEATAEPVIADLGSSEGSAAVEAAETGMTEPIAADSEPAQTTVAPIAPETYEATTVTPADVAATASGRTRSLLGRFRPGQNIDAELAAFERTADTAQGPQADGAPELRVEEVVAPEAEVPLAVEPVAAEPVAVEAEPVAAEAVVVEAVVVEAEVDSPVQADVVEQPVWRIVAPDDAAVAPPPTNGQPVPPLPTGEPQWPTAPTDRLDFLRRPRANDDVWAASSKDLFAAAPVPLPGGAGPVAIQSCSGCGLSLSATARFCRRCGTRQG